MFQEIAFCDVSVLIQMCSRFFCFSCKFCIKTSTLAPLYLIQSSIRSGYKTLRQKLGYLQIIQSTNYSIDNVNEPPKISCSVLYLPIHTNQFLLNWTAHVQSTITGEKDITIMARGRRSLPRKGRFRIYLTLSVCSRVVGNVVNKSQLI